MVLKLYVSANSPNARLVAVVLHEKKVPFEVIELDFDKDLKSPKYLKLQPFGQEPTIVRKKKTCITGIFHVFCFFQDDDGFILYESRAIAHYIASKYSNQGTPLLPTELEANALFHQAASVSISHFSPHAEKIVSELYYKP